MSLTQQGPNLQPQLPFGEVPLWKRPQEELFALAVANGWNPKVLRAPGGMDNLKAALELGDVVCGDCLDPVCKGCIR